MECLKISPDNTQATPSEDSILSTIISQLEKTLSYFLVQEPHNE